MSKLKVTLYTRENCPLCLEVEEELNRLQDQYPHDLIRIDVEENDLASLVDKIPVLEIGPYKVQAPIDLEKIAVTLGAAQDRMAQLEKISSESHQRKKKRSQKISIVDRFFFWLSKRYMTVFNGFVLIFVGLAFLAPVLQSGGKTTPAKIIYTVYGTLCHQLAYRSWFLYGDQIAYPRAEAQVGELMTYSQATGLDPFDVESAVTFKGNETTGYKVALCQRDIAIYAGILLFGLLFSITKRKIPGLPIGFWFVLGILPIGFDGISQIISQLPWDLIPLRESTPFLRSLTGGLFGFSTAWFGYPIVEESMADTRKILAVKLKISKIERTE